MAVSDAMSSILSKYHINPKKPPQIMSLRSQDVSERAEINGSVRLTGDAENRNIFIKESGTEFEPIWIGFDQLDMHRTKVIVLGNHVHLIGGKWHDSMVEIQGDYNRVCGAQFADGERNGNNDRLNSGVLMTRNASYNRVDHCEFKNWNRNAIRQAFITGGKGFNLIDHNWIHDCWFGKNMGDEKGKNGTECFQSGASREEINYQTCLMIAFNVVENWDNEVECVSMKTDDVFVYHNVFRNMPRSTITSRLGSDCEIIGNQLIDTMGIRIFGENNVVDSNNLSGAGDIRVYSGDCSASQVKNGEFPGGHPAARNSVVTNNTLDKGEIIIGERGTGKVMYYDEQHLPAYRTVLAKNTGMVKMIEHHRETEFEAIYDDKMAELFRPPDLETLMNCYRGMTNLFDVSQGQNDDEKPDMPDNREEIKKLKKRLRKLKRSVNGSIKELEGLKAEVLLAQEAVKEMATFIQNPEQ